ncbi:MAG: hypothetical protein AAFR60_01495, partial [Pseudomonadota bacterium]
MRFVHPIVSALACASVATYGFQAAAQQTRIIQGTEIPTTEPGQSREPTSTIGTTDRSTSRTFGTTSSSSTTPLTSAASFELKNRFVEFDDLIVQPFNISVDRVENRNIYDRSGQKNGEVDEVQFRDDQRNDANSITVARTELGLGCREVVVEMDSLVRK